MHTFEKVTEYIYKLAVPFADNYTSVFLVRTEAGDLLVDAATTESDVTDVILPALHAMGANVTAVFCTHLHGDHAGGLPYLLPALGGVSLYAAHASIAKYETVAHPCRAKDGDMLLGVLRVLHLQGHSSDSCALLDTRTGALLTGDCVQQYGVSRWGVGVGLPLAYRASLLRLAETEGIETLIAAHPYVPDGWIAEGRAAVRAYIKEAAFDFDRVVEFTRAHADLGDAKAIADAFTAHYQKEYPNLPILQASTVEQILKCGNLL